MELTVSVVDAHTGRPAVALPVMVERQESDGWYVVAEGETDERGLLRYKAIDGDLSIHRCVVNTERYFTALGITSSYSDVVVTLRDINSSRSVSVFIAARSYLVYDTNA